MARKPLLKNIEKKILKYYSEHGKFPSKNKLNSIGINFKNFKEHYDYDTVIKNLKKKYQKKIGKLDDLAKIAELKRTYIRIAINQRKHVDYQKFKSHVRKDKKLYKASYSSYDVFQRDCERESETLRDILEKRQANRLRLAKAYTELSWQIKAYPTYTEIIESGIMTRAEIVHNFKDVETLKGFANLTFKSIFDKIYQFDEIFTPKRQKEIVKMISKCDRFIVTTIGSGFAFRPAIRSMLNYSKRNKAMVICLIAKQNIERIDYTLIDLHQRGHIHLLIDDVAINENIMLSTMEIDEKMVNPLGGMDRYAKNNELCSYVFASPKQMRRPVPVKKTGLPRLLISTGACTLPAYYSDKYRRGRRCLIAHSDHLLGAIVIEKDGDKLFHTRQIQFNTEDDEDNNLFCTGSFADWGVEYRPDGSVNVHLPDIMIFGDLHSYLKDKNAYVTFLEICKELGIETIGLHDVYDSVSTNPHERKKATYRQYLEFVNQSQCSNELIELKNDLNIATSYVKKVKIIDSNHDDMLQRGFDNGMIYEDPRNAIIADFVKPYAVVNHFRGTNTSEKEIWKKVSEVTQIPVENLKKHFPFLGKAKKTLQYAVELYGLDHPEKIEWLDLDSSWTYAGFELADHGHKGSNGARGGIGASERVFNRKIEGHSHTDGQFNRVARVGHIMQMNPQPKYTLGSPTSWIMSCINLYSSGQFNHITYIDGKYRKEDGLLSIKKAKSLGRRDKVKIPTFSDQNNEDIEVSYVAS
ncbi:MAG: hypothetical protein GY909_16090 [Oligoflexia bacterium]|nr:hypothetical protein [Oligoflexia bacterium]